MEQWKPIPGYEGRYEVSSLGRVRSLDMVVKVKNGHRISKGRLLKPDNVKGYLRVTLCPDSKTRVRYFVHRLVLFAFKGPPSEDQKHTRHINGDPTDNSLSNLLWGTCSENTYDKIKHDTWKNPIPKKRVRRSDGKIFESVCKGAKESNTTSSNICCVLKGRRNRAGGYGWEYVN